MTRPTRPNVHHVALTVTDVDSSIGWYERIFDIRHQVDIPHEGGVGKLLSNEDRSLMFVLHRHDANDGGLFSERATGLDHVGLAVTTRAELEDWERHLAENDVVLADEAAKPFTRSAIRTTSSSSSSRPRRPATPPDRYPTPIPRTRSAARLEVITSSSSTGCPSGPERGMRQFGYSSVVPGWFCVR
jgi:glyoxylase I family protein